MDAQSLKSKTVRELRRIAADLEIPGRSKRKKVELIELIRDALDTGVEAHEVVESPTSSTSSTVVTKAPEVDAEPKREPTEGEVYIDRGPPLPLGYEGTRVRVMVRDPDALFVYWEVPDHVTRDDWHVAAVDPHGNTLESFRVGGGEHDGYLHVPADEVRYVVLSPAWRSGEVSSPFATVELPEFGLRIGGPAPWVRVHRDAFLPELIEARYRAGYFADQDQLLEAGRAVTPTPDAPVPDPEGWTLTERSGPSGRSPKWSSFQFASHTLARSKR